MKVLVIGNGGRESAIVWKVKQSPLVDEVFAASGNGGIQQLAGCVDIAPDNIHELIRFAENKSIDLTVVGPEVPLVNGIVDFFEEKGLKIFGPNKKAAILEGSKSYAKEFMRKHGIPTGRFRVFSAYDEALKSIGIFGFPVVIKVDGLAAGKGVSIAYDEAQAKETLKKIFVKRRFGDAGNYIVLEEFLTGWELSMLCFVDGKTIVPMESVRDYKKVFDNDKGPNTGGMGAISPVDIYTPEIEKEFKEKVMLPTFNALKKERIDYRGVLYFGLIMTDEGLKVLEFNCRFGDPETQVLLPRLENDLVEVMLAVAENKLDNQNLCWNKKAAVCVIMASKGYPGRYETGKAIEGLENVNDAELYVFHAGTKYKEGKLCTAGGRVLGITALGRDINEARERVYCAVEEIRFEGAHYRLDIAK